MANEIKKVYADIFAFLQANADKKIKAIMPELLEMVTSKQMSSTFRKDAKGNVTHVFCYYHKKWEDITIAEYGNKATSASSLNSMCKEGVNQWTKQQRDLKKAKEDVLTKVGKGEITPDQIHDLLVQAEAATKLIVPRKDEHGSDVEPDEVEPEAAE